MPSYAAIMLGVAGALACGCSIATPTDPGAAITGIYSLEGVTGFGPASGTFVLTRQGYAERRVRYRLSDSTMTREFLARGSAEYRADSTIALTLREIDPASDLPWEPDAKLTPEGIEISYLMLDGSTTVERYRRN
jgi:hypothetical protein